jgi:hypothetical protein
MSVSTGVLPLCATVMVDWVGDGAFASPVSDVTADVPGDPGLVIDTGRDGARALSPPKVPSASFELRNDHGRYSNERGASPVYQLVRPGTPVVMSASYGTPRLYRSAALYRSAVAYRGVAAWTLARTRIDAANQSAELGSQRVRVSTLGATSTLVGTAVTVPLQTAIRTDQAVTMILDAAGWPAARRAISLGDTTLAYWWADGRSAWDALVEITTSEGPGCMYEDADGVLHWEGRNYRAVTPRSTTPQAAFFDQRVGGGVAYRGDRPYRANRLYRGNVAALYFTALTYEPGWKTLYARATYATKRRALGALGAVWRYGADITLSAGQSRTFFARPADPFQNAVAPVVTTDYVIAAGSATVALTYTSGILAVITVTAGGGGCTIVGPAGSPTGGLQLRAQPLAVVSETVVQSSLPTTGPAAAYGGVQTLDVAGWPEVDPAMAEGVCNAWVVRYNVPRPQVTISVVAVDGAHFGEIVQRGVSDRISLRSEATGIAADVWIESREIIVSGAGGRHVEAIWKCEKVDTISGFVWDGSTSLWDSAIWGS